MNKKNLYAFKSVFPADNLIKNKAFKKIKMNKFSILLSSKNRYDKYNINKFYVCCDKLVDRTK